MNRTTAYLISCSDHYEHRLRFFDEQLRKCGYKTVYITSDFDHSTKSHFRSAVPNCVQLEVLPYEKNLSVKRIISHWQFARKVVRYLEKLDEEPDVIVALLPPNFLAHYLAKFKKNHKSTKLIFDIFDLWPETFPSSGVKKLLTPVFWLWARLRDHSLPKADCITAECELFREKLGLSEENSRTIYLCEDDLEDKHLLPNLPEDRWQLCYLGAVNNVIGIPEICRLVEHLNRQKPVTVHIIGLGERLALFAQQLKDAGADVICHGPVYDDERKQEIIHKCHFGINIVSSAACIGLTMKSVEYFRHGLPIISNIPADTQHLVERNGVGIQYDEQTADQIAGMSNEDCLQMRRNVRNLFRSTFSKQVVEKQYEDLFRSCL